jgi:HK97 family phage major capsid protein
MGNVVLERLLAERAEAIRALESILEQVDGRDLTDAETEVLNRTRDRIAQLDRQIDPLEEYETVKAAHAGTVASLPHPEPRHFERLPAEPRRADGGDRAPVYRSAGHFVADLCRASGCQPGGTWGPPDEAAAQRVYQARVVADQKTSDTTGVLPTPIVGPVVDLIDSNRPLISSLGGARAMAGIPGATFSRPKITQHVTVGAQAGEKTQLPSQKMTITPVNFTKSTYGGTVDISRQDIDWTSPSAWDILIKDLADVYAVQTETAVAAAFKAASTATPVAVATNDLKGWALALYTAAMHSYQAAFRMPDRIWCSLDVWAAWGSLVDVARLVIPQDTVSEMGAPGTSSLASFAGDLLGVPRIVVPTFVAGTCLVGNSSLYEVYEEIIGLLSVVEPSILGVQVAYGGYVAYGTLSATGIVPLTVPAGMPTVLDAGTGVADQQAYIDSLRAQLEAAEAALAETQAAAEPPAPPAHASGATKKSAG